MSKVLRNWIAPVVEEKLVATSRFLEGNYIPGQNIQNDDFSCQLGIVTIHLKHGRHIQIVNVNGRHENPFYVTVSDGTTRIQATFAKQATVSFAKYTGRDLASIQGGIFGVEDFKLTFNPNAASSKRLLLHVTKFKLMGSEGSPIFGRPSDILRHGGIKKALENLENLLSGPGNTSNTELGPSSPIRSQAGDLSDHSSPPATNGASQPAFATQVNEKFGKHPVKKFKKLPKPLPATHDRLLEDFRTHHRQNSKSIQESTKDTKTDVSNPSKSNASNSRNPPALLRISRERVMEMTPKLEARANELQSQPSISFKAIRSSEPKNQPTSLQDPDRLLPSKFLASGDSEKENSQESLIRENILPPENSGEPNGPPLEQERQTFKLSFNDQFQTANPFKGLKRVPRKFVRIPDDQQIILEGKCSWFNPYAHDRASYASIPTQVKDDLAAFIVRQPAPGSERHRSGSDLNNKQSADLQDRSLESRSKPENLSGTDDDGESVHGVDFNEIEEGISKEHASWISSPDENTRAQPPETFETTRSLSVDGIKEDNSIEDTKHRENNRINSSMPDGFGAVLSQNSTNLTHEYRYKPPRPQPSRYKRVPVAILSSSPVEEEELELAIPHAVGDLVEDSDVEMNESPEISQELPSTALQNPGLVQVEHTPFNHHRAPNKGLPQTKQLSRQAEVERKLELDTASSNPIIPATFHDTSPPRYISSPKSKELKLVEVLSISQNAGQEQSCYSLQNIHTLHTQSQDNQDNHREEIQSREHLLCESSQRQQHKLDHTSLILSTSIHEIPREVKTLSPKPERDLGTSTPLDPNPYRLSPPVHFKPTPMALDSARSPEQTPSFNLSSPAMLSSSKRKNNDMEEIIQSKPSKRRWNVPAAVFKREAQSPLRDTREMVRVNRHNFLNEIKNMEPQVESLRSISSELQVPGTIPVSDPSASCHTDNIAPSSPRNELSAEQPILDTPEAHTVDQPNLTSIRPRPASGSTRSEPSKRSETVINYVSPEHATPVLYLNCYSGSVPSKPNFFEEFRSIYPDYAGEKEDFTWALVYIEWLRKGGQLLHRSLCDDFIRVYASDYLMYITEFGASAKMTGWEFYDKNITKREYHYEFITPSNLQEAILSLEPSTVQQFRKAFAAPRPRNLSVPYLPSKYNSTALARSKRNESYVEKKIVPEVKQSGGTSSVTSVTTKTRQQYFETPSQLPTTKLEQVSATPDSSVAGPIGSETEVQSARHRLPWPSTPSPQVKSRDINLRKAISTGSSESRSIPKPTIEGPEHGPYRNLFQGSANSPILGAKKSFTKPSNPTPRAEFHTPSRNRDAPKSPCRPTSNPISQRVSGTSKSKIDIEGWRFEVEPSPSAGKSKPQVMKNETSVQEHQGGPTSEWSRSTPKPKSLVMKEKSSFQKFYTEKMRKSGGLPSNASTPRSTSGSAKRFCTKLKRGPRFERAEPDTRT